MATLVFIYVFLIVLISVITGMYSVEYEGDITFAEAVVAILFWPISVLILTNLGVRLWIRRMRAKKWNDKM